MTHFNPQHTLQKHLIEAKRLQAQAQYTEDEVHAAFVAGTINGLEIGAGYMQWLIDELKNRLGEIEKRRWQGTTLQMAMKEGEQLGTSYALFITRHLLGHEPTDSSETGA